MGLIGKKHGSGEPLTPEFLELERRKRYGYVNKMEEMEGFYKIFMFLPTIVPPCELAEKLGLPREMPDYKCDSKLDENVLTVRGRLTDEKVLKLTGIVNSFPDRFLKEFVFGKPVSHFKISYSDKVLEITVYKKASDEQEP